MLFLAIDLLSGSDSLESVLGQRLQHLSLYSTVYSIQSIMRRGRMEKRMFQVPASLIGHILSLIQLIASSLRRDPSNISPKN